MKHYYFVVEGAHDVATIGKLLKQKGIREIRNQKLISDVWINNLIPEKFPFKDDRLDRITPIPSFYQSEEITIAIHVAGGETEIVNTLDLSITNLKITDLKEIDGIILVCDADNMSAQDKKQILIESINDKDDIFFNNDRKLAKIKKLNIKMNLFIFPDNNHKGTLEDLLLDCAKVEYRDLLDLSNEYLSRINLDYKDSWSCSAENKVLVGWITNVLKPGKSNQVSITDNSWISEETISGVNSLNKLAEFIFEFISE